MKIDLMWHGYDDTPLFTYKFNKESQEFKDKYLQHHIYRMTVDIDDYDLNALVRDCKTKDSLSLMLWRYQQKKEAKQELIEFINELRQIND